MNAVCYAFMPILFHMSSASIVVYPKLLESRADDGRLTLQVHPGLILTLEKSSILTKHLQFVSSFEHSTTIFNGEELERNLYQDTTQMSSLIVDRVQSGVQVHGILNHRLKIAPLAVASRSSNGGSAHEITEIQQKSTEASAENTEDDEDAYKQYCDPINITSKGVERDAPDVFCVEVCIVVSRNYTSAFNSTEELLLYLAAMLNGVALRYIEIKCPEIRFQLNKVLEVQDKFLFGDKVCGIPAAIQEHGENDTLCRFDAVETFNKTRDHVSQCVTAECDVVYHLTREDLGYCVAGNCTIDVTGIAERAGICTDEKFAIGEDDPHTYNGLITMAHELGHSLGSDHDSCEGAEECPARYGNLMTNINMNMRNKSRLSECSKRQIRSLLRRLEPSCINVSTVANYRNEGYPGENITHDEFCRLMHPEKEDIQASTESGMEDAQDCNIECCWNETLGTDNGASSSCSETELAEFSETTTEDIYGYSDDEPLLICAPHSMLDGMPCSEDKTCYRGVCGTHNWSLIKRNYSTFRTFPNIS